MNRSIKELLANMEKLSEDDKYSLMYSIFSVRSVKEIPGDVFHLVYAFMEVIATAATSGETISSELIELLSLMACQLLALSGHLKNISPLPEDMITNIRPINPLPKNWEENVLEDYKSYIKETEKADLFIKSLGKITSNELILCAASNFVYYQTKFNLNDDEQIEKNIGLVNLTKLCINEKIVKELQEILKEFFDISLIDFLSKNAEIFINTCS